MVVILNCIRTLYPAYLRGTVIIIIKHHSGDSPLVGRRIEIPRKALTQRIAKKRFRLRDDSAEFFFKARGFAALTDEIRDEFHARFERRALRHAEANEVLRFHDDWMEWWRNGDVWA